MIDETVKIHDVYQFEIKQWYNIFPGRNNSYFVSTYIFVPRNLNINRDTYSSADFYRDLHTYIRLRTPLITLREMASGGRPRRLIHESVEKLIHGADPSSILELEYRLKMWATVFKRSLRNEIVVLCATTEQDKIAALAADYVSSVYEVLSSFRNYVQPLRNHPDEKVRLSVCYADEFAGMKAESHALRILENIENRIALEPELRKKLIAFAQEEKNYRNSMGYPSGADPSDGGKDETYLYRQSVLKKYLNSGLFLETRLHREGRFLEQILLSGAAGLAMVFATAIAFFAQKKYGGLTFAVFVAVVVSYMLKDRMKEYMKSYLSNTMRRWVYDRKRVIYHGFRRPIGYCKESFNYMDEKDVPSEVRKLRSRDPMADLDNSLVGENVILYRKYVCLNAAAFKTLSPDYPIDGITDIMRFHITDYLQTMDDPAKTIYTSTENGWKRFMGRRVYHLNMITLYRWGRNSVYRRFRIVMNRNGIQRIEEVNS